MMESNQNLLLKIAAAGNFVLVLALGYGLSSINGTLTDRIAKVESANEETQAENDKTIKGLLADLDQVKKRVGMTAVELNHTQKQAQTLKHQQELSSKAVATQLASKANSSYVDVFRQDATNQIAEVQRDSDAKYGTVSGEVTVIKHDLLATRDDLGRQLTDVTNVLSERIATNSGELAELRKKGDRDYFEFDIRKNSKQPFNHVSDLQLALLKTDPKKHRYNVAIQVDDNRLEKKDRTANEPVQFLVGRDRYEVVNS